MQMKLTGNGQALDTLHCFTVGWNGDRMNGTELVSADLFRRRDERTSSDVHMAISHAIDSQTSLAVVARHQTKHRTDLREFEAIVGEHFSRHRFSDV